MIGVLRMDRFLLVTLLLFTWCNPPHPIKNVVVDGRWHVPPSANSSTVFVFIHGVLSDSKACWTYLGPHGAVFWPDLIRRDTRFGTAAIYLASYPAKAFGGDGEYGIRNAADDVWRELLRTDSQGNPPVMSKTNIIIVGHSTGAIIIKRLVEQHQKELAGKNVGVVLIASPSLGSRLGSTMGWVSQQFKNKIGHDLTWNNDVLLDIDDRFRQIVEARPSWLHGVEAYEQYPMRLAGLVSVEVAPRATADRGYFGVSYMLPGTDHESTVKPPTFGHPGYSLLLDFYTNLIKDVSKKVPAAVAFAHPFDNAVPRWLTQSGSARLVALSPDGDWIAYVEAVGNAEQVALQQLSDPDSHPRRIVAPLSQTYRGISFSRDSKSIYFVRSLPENTLESELFKTDLMGTSSRMLIPDVDSGVAISPDGSQVAFIRGVEHANKLVICKSDGTECHVRAVQKLPYFFSYEAMPVWLANSNAVACVYGNVNVPRSMTIHAYAVDSNRDWPLLQTSWWSISSIAAIDNDKLIVAADSNGDVSRRLWIAAQGKRAELLFPTLDDYRSVTLSGNGRRLAAINLTRAVALRIAFPSEQWAVKPLTADRGDPGVYGAAWKSNGEIIYVESGAEGRRLWSMHADGTGTTQLTRVGRDRAGDVYPRGCHDGSIVFTSFRPTPSVVVRRQDGSETTVGTGFFPDCSDEGRIIFTTYGSQNLGHSIVDRNGQVIPTHCLDASLLHPTFSPDGTTVAGFTLDLKAHHWTITTCDLSTGRVRTLWHTSLRDSRFPWIRWRPDGRSLTYLSPRDGALEVWMIPLDGKPTREGIVDGEAAFALDWSRDGTKLLYAAGKTRSDVLMYEVPMK